MRESVSVMTPDEPVSCRFHSTTMPSIVAPVGIENPNPVAFSPWLLVVPKNEAETVAADPLSVVAFPGFVHAVVPIDESLTQDDA